jgi:hypothetical protein
MKSKSKHRLAVGCSALLGVGGWSQSAWCKSSVCALMLDNAIKLFSCARLLLRIAILKLRLVCRCLLGELRFQFLELVIRCFEPRTKPPAVDGEWDGDEKQDNDPAPDGHEMNGPGHDRVTERLDEREQCKHGSTNEGATGIVESRRAVISEKAHVMATPNENWTKNFV